MTKRKVWFCPYIGMEWNIGLSALIHRPKFNCQLHLKSIQSSVKWEANTSMNSIDSRSTLVGTSNRAEVLETVRGQPIVMGELQVSLYVSKSHGTEWHLFINEEENTRICKDISEGKLMPMPSASRSSRDPSFALPATASLTTPYLLCPTELDCSPQKLSPLLSVESVFGSVGQKPAPLLLFHSICCEGVTKTNDVEEVAMRCRHMLSLP